MSVLPLSRANARLPRATDALPGRGFVCAFSRDQPAVSGRERQERIPAGLLRAPIRRSDFRTHYATRARIHVQRQSNRHAATEVNLLENRRDNFRASATRSIEPVMRHAGSQGVTLLPTPDDPQSRISIPSGHDRQKLPLTFQTSESGDIRNAGGSQRALHRQKVMVPPPLLSHHRPAASGVLVGMCVRSQKQKASGFVRPRM